MVVFELFGAAVGLWPLLLVVSRFLRSDDILMMMLIVGIDRHNHHGRGDEGEGLRRIDVCGRKEWSWGELIDIDVLPPRGGTRRM